MAGSIASEPSLFLDVDRDLLKQPPTQPVVERLVHQVQSEHPRAIVLNFHEATTVPCRCQEFIRAVRGAEPDPPQIVVTEAGVGVRRWFVDHGMLPIEGLDRGRDALVLSRRADYEA